MKLEKKVSVIVPVYNCEDTLSRCLDSILCQTIIVEIEIILINDGSTDDSLEIMKKYQKLYPETIRVFSQKNKGQSAARNFGISVAEGKYIGFVDGDDYIDMLFFELLSSKMGSDVDLVVAGRYNMDADTIKKEKLPSLRINNCSMKDSVKVLSETSTLVCDKLFKLELIRDNDIKFPEKYRYAEDFHFLCRYKYYCKKVSVINEALYYYTKNERSITNSCDVRWLDICSVLEEMRTFFKCKYKYSEVEDELLKISIGFYCRRIRVMKTLGNRVVQVCFVVKMLKYLRSFKNKNWKEKIDQYPIKDCIRIRKSSLLMCVYICLPSMIKNEINNKGGSYQ